MNFIPLHKDGELKEGGCWLAIYVFTNKKGAVRDVGEEKSRREEQQMK